MCMFCVHETKVVHGQNSTWRICEASGTNVVVFILMKVHQMVLSHRRAYLFSPIMYMLQYGSELGFQETLTLSVLCTRLVHQLI